MILSLSNHSDDFRGGAASRALTEIQNEAKTLGKTARTYVKKIKRNLAASSLKDYRFMQKANKEKLLKNTRKQRSKELPALRPIQDSDGNTPLHKAILARQHAIIKDLIKKKVNIDIQNKEGGSPLNLAVRLKIVSVVKRLLKHGANIELTDLYGASALAHAVIMNSVDMVKILIGDPKANLSSTGLVHSLAKWVKTRSFDFNPSIFLRVFGLRFGLNGSYKTLPLQCVKKSIPLKFSGFSSMGGIRVLSCDLLNYMQSGKSSLSPRIKKSIKKMCIHAFAIDEDKKIGEEADNLMTLLDQGFPITIAATWPGHCVNLTLTKKQIVFSNKWTTLRRYPGMRIYEITKEIDRENLSKILAFNKIEDFPSDEERVSSLEDLLGLKFQRYVRSKFQKVGNCAFASNTLCFRAALLLLGVSDSKSLEEYKNFEQYSKLYWLDVLLGLLDKPSSDPHLITELYFPLLVLVQKLSLKEGQLGITLTKDQEIVERIREAALKFQKSRGDHPYLDEILKVAAGHNLDQKNILPNHLEVISNLNKLYPESFGDFTISDS